MNKFDKKLHKALNFFANNDLGHINELKKKQEHKFRKLVPLDIERFAFQEHYLDADKRWSNTITPKGLEQLRALDSILTNEKTFWISIGALVFSIISFTISLAFGLRG